MATTDLHAHLAAHDYFTDSPSPRWGLVRTATLIRHARAEVRDSILLDNGDFLQGSPLGDHAALNRHGPDPVIAAMNALDYDAVNLGNHEFSHGLDRLRRAMDEARFPCLSANTLPAPDATDPALPALRPWVILERQLTGDDGTTRPCRIGVIGVLPPETAIWDSQAIAGRLQMLPMATTVARHLPALRKAGADLVVVLAHCGFGSSDPRSGDEGDARAIAALDGVDALVLGHVHLAFPQRDAPGLDGIDPLRGRIHGKPAVMPGFYGSHLGLIDLDLCHDGTGWRVLGHRARLRPIARRRADGSVRSLAGQDARLAGLIATAHAAARDWTRRPIGQSAVPIHSYFSLVTDTPALQLVNRAQMAHVEARLRGGPHAGLPVLSATAPFKAGGRGGPENFTDIPPGDLLLRHAADLYIHPNTVMALRLNGAGIRNWLEHSARGYRRILPGQPDQPLLDPDLPSFLFDTISGLSYQIDLSAPPCEEGGRRIRNLTWQGRPLDDRQDFILATNSYRGSGGGGIAPIDRAQVVLSEPVANRDALIGWLGRATGPFRHDPPGWHFAPLPGASVLFDTAPEAAAHLDEVPDLALTPLERMASGFLRLRLSL